jgi:type IV fimbrial biogenesis protein FimT
MGRRSGDPSCVTQYRFACGQAPVHCLAMNKHQTGFTLTEMMVVTAIVAILLGIAIPSYQYLTTSYRMSAELNNLSGDLQYARAEAVKEGNSVTMCVSADGASCTGGTNWNAGWIVFSDPNANATVDPGERVMKVAPAFNGTTPDSANSQNAATSSVTYNREGFASFAAFAGTQVDIKDPNNTLAYTRCLLVVPVGTVSSLNNVHDPLVCP